MRYFSFLISVLFFSQPLLAQGNEDDTDKTGIKIYEDKTVKNEIGFDMFFFLNLFRQQYEGQPSTVFKLVYNRELNDKISLRTELGSGYTNNNYKKDTLPTLHSLIVEENLKLGIAWKKQVYRGFQFYYGLDIEFQYGYSKEQQNQSGNDVLDNINTVYLIGPGPFVGLIVYLNPRVSLSIESNLNFVYSNDKAVTRDGVHPELNSTTTTKGFTTTYITPQNIFLSIKF